jgi:hypothetical protein
MEHLTSMWHWEPASPGKNPLNKCCKQGRMDLKPAKDFIAANTAFRSGNWLCFEPHGKTGSGIG